MATSWALPVALSPPPTGREAVADALYRCILGIDTNDLGMFSSAFTADGRLVLNETTLDGLPSIISGCYDRLARLDTTHHVTNLRIDMDEGGGPTASMTASVIANHYRIGEGLRESGDAPRMLTGALYKIDLVEGEAGGRGLWKIKEFYMKTVWGEGDHEVMKG